MKRTITLMLLMAFTLATLAQGRLITGRVTDEKGTGLPGVTIQLLETTTGTITDMDGNYQIQADEGVLKFSFVGFLSQEIPLTGQATIDIVLQEDIQNLEEVVVVGYGVQRKKDLTTAVTTVGEEAIKERPLVSPVEALQGKAAGVQVLSPSGKPGTELSVRVRGATSVLAGNEPLYVIDGVPTTDIQGLNPADIASMTVLKDASSSAIYGARAANGVVLITTRRGSTEVPSVSFNAYYGISRLRKTIDVLSTRDYWDMMEEIQPGSFLPKETGYTNWGDSVFGTGHKQSYQLSFGGGSEKSKYYFSAGYLSDEGIVDPARFDRYSVRLNLDNEVTRWLKIGTSINVLHSTTKDTPDNLSSGRGGVIMSALNTPPFLDTYYKDVTKNIPGSTDVDSTGWFDPNPFQPSWENPIAYMKGADQESIDNRIFGNITADVSLTKGLNFKTNFGLDLMHHQWDYYLDPFRTNYGRDQHGIGQSDKYNHSTWLWENTLNYVTSFKKSNLSALIGSSIQKYKGNQSYIYGNDFPEDVSVTTLNAANSISASTDIQEWSLASFFGRVTYDYANKYYLTASVRHDGSSKLHQHWGTMPSFSAGWRISAEPFMENVDFITDLKIRGGWGMNGNQEGIPNYTQYGLVSYWRRTPTNPLSGPASGQTTLGNPDLKWETTVQSNIGVDLTMFDSRVALTLDAYIKKTNDVLLNVQLPNTFNITTIQTNAGDIENRGIEFNIHSVNIDRALRWDSDLNMSFNKNEVTGMDYTKVFYFGRIYSNNQEVAIVRQGLPLGTFYGYVSEGVDPETGNLKFKDLNNNGILDPGDRTVIGDGNPDFTFGFTNTFTFRRFDLNLFLQGSYGNDIYNATRVDLEGMFDSKNQSTVVLDRWTPGHTDTDIPKAGNISNVRNSTRFVEDGSYLRLKSVTLSYRLIENNKAFNDTRPFKAIRNLSIYITGQNLLTFTKYSGFDPEVNAYGQSATELGIDYGTYPQSISVIFGINVEI